MRRNAKTDLSGGVYADEMQKKAPDRGMWATRAAFAKSASGRLV
jgi:hypothetical protein